MKMLGKTKNDSRIRQLDYDRLYPIVLRACVAGPDRSLVCNSQTSEVTAEGHQWVHSMTCALLTQMRDDETVPLELVEAGALVARRIRDAFRRLLRLEEAKEGDVAILSTSVGGDELDYVPRSSGLRDQPYPFVSDGLPPQLVVTTAPAHEGEG